MLKILSIFAKKVSPSCGAEESVNVVDRFGRTVARLFYRQPSGDMRLEYIDCRIGLLDESESISSIKNAGAGHETKAIYKLYRDELFLPFAERIFIRSEGYRTDNNKPVDVLSKSEQFEWLKKYYPDNLSDMTVIAFEPKYSVKKKD